MHTDFGEWFLAAGIEMPGDTLLKRWAGVEALPAGASEVISLTELFYGFYESTEGFIAGFRTAFQGADPSFRMRDNNLELSVLAGAKLVWIMENAPSLLADLATLAVVSCAAQNLRGTPPVKEIPEMAAKRLSRRTVSRKIVELRQVQQGEQITPEIQHLQRDVAIIGEESNILWWVFGESSRDLDQRWSKLTFSQTALIAGKELADLTRIQPGPAAALALLDRVIRMVRGKFPADIIVCDAIGELPAQWRQDFAKKLIHPNLLNLCPVSHAIKLSLDLQGEGAWLQALPKATQMQKSSKIAPTLLAYQIYIENLLSSLWLQVK